MENVYYKDIEKYIIEKYNERLLRMTEPPVFVLGNYIARQKNDEKILLDIIHSDPKYKIIIVTDDKNLMKHKHKNILFFFL